MENDFTKELTNSSPLKAILDGIGYAISIQDADLKVLYQNSTHKKLIGDHRGDYCYRGFHGLQNVCKGCPVVKAFQDGAAHSAVRTGAADKGTIYAEVMASPLRDANGKITAAIEIARDITDRVKADEALIETKQMLEEVTQGITESILLLSTDYRILWANKTAVEQIGLPRNKLIGEYCYAATHDLGRQCEPPNEPCPVRELLKTGEPTTAEHEHHDKDGGSLHAEVSAYPIKDSTGKIVRFVHISKNITERKTLAQEREKLIRELQDALVQIRTLKGIIPICSSCKNIRNDRGYWEQMEEYISKNSEAEFSHGICPTCAKTLYSDLLKNEE